MAKSVKKNSEYAYYSDMAQMLRRSALLSIMSSVNAHPANKAQQIPNAIYVNENEDLFLLSTGPYKKKVQAILAHGVRTSIQRGIVCDYEIVRWGEMRLDDIINITKYI